jgi:2-iminobutanoate/2-iminopropanoate deaminase
MTKEIFNPGGQKPALPLSHAVKGNGLIFISGQLPFLANGEYPQSFADQVSQVFINLSAALAAANLKLEDVVKTTVFLKNMDDFAELNKIYGQHFSANPPARSTIEVARLPKDALVEIEAVAA